MGFFSSIGKWLGSNALGLIGIGGSLLNSKKQADASKEINERNLQFNAEQSALAFQRQQELIKNTPSLNKAGLIDAGISPAALNGFSGGSASVSSASAPPSQPESYPIDFNTILNALTMQQQVNNVKANTRKTNADAKSQELDNKIKETEMNSWERATNVGYFVDDNGNRHYEDDYDFNKFVDTYTKSHNGQIPDLVKPNGVYSFGAAQVHSAISDLRTKIKQNDMYSVQSDLAKRVAQLKLADSDVMRAIYKMDVAQYDMLLKQIQKIGSDIDVNKTIEDLNKANTKAAKQDILESVARTMLIGKQSKSIDNSNVANMIDQLSSDKSFGDNMATVGKIILTMLQSALGVSFSGSIGSK